MRSCGVRTMSKPNVWRWQERYIEDGIEGLLRDKTRPSRIPPPTEAVKLAVLTKTATEERSMRRTGAGRRWRRR